MKPSALYFYAVIAFTTIPLASSFAACTSPHGESGYTRTSGGTSYTCDGTNWNEVEPFATESYVDSATSGGGIPTGAVMAFDLSSCPSGWSEYTAARGRFLRGIDSTGSVDPDGVRTAGSTQADSIGQHSHSEQYPNGGTKVSYNQYGNTVGGAAASGTTSTTGSGIGTETRPKNVAVLFCRKD